jgi:hypothetical protein
MTADPADLMEQNIETFRVKNALYGDSWKLSGKTMALWFREMGVTELVIPVDETALISLGQYHRRLDKLIRGFNMEFVTDERAFESLTDAHLDDGNYAVMHASLFVEEADDPVPTIADGGVPVTRFDPAAEPADPAYEAAYRELTDREEC